MQYLPIICTVLSCVLAVTGFFLGQKNGLKSNSYEQGQKDANIANELKNINKKLDDVIKDTVSREEFAEYKQRIVVLEKNVFKKGDE